MTYEERLEAAERQRLRGNALFQEVLARHLFWLHRILATCTLTWPHHADRHSLKGDAC